jgi:hypothetical protein
MPIVLFFILSNAFFIAGRDMLERWHADQDVLIIGNALLFIVTMCTYLLSRNAMKKANPNVFVRSVYGSFMIKFFVFIIAAFIYISTTRKGLNKPALFTCMGLYLLYSFMEVTLLMKLLKEKKNA